MKLSGHEKALVDAGRRGHAMAALVDRTGCGLRDAFEMVVAYGDAQKPKRRLERVYWVLKKGHFYASIGELFDAFQAPYLPRDQATEFERYSDALVHRRAGEKVFRVSVFRVRGKVKP